MTRSPLQNVKLPLGLKQDLQLYALFHYKLIQIWEAKTFNLSIVQYYIPDLVLYSAVAGRCRVQW